MVINLLINLLFLCPSILTNHRIINVAVTWSALRTRKSWSWKRSLTAIVDEWAFEIRLSRPDAAITNLPIRSLSHLGTVDLANNLTCFVGSIVRPHGTHRGAGVHSGDIVDEPCRSFQEAVARAGDAETSTKYEARRYLAPGQKQKNRTGRDRGKANRGSAVASTMLAAVRPRKEKWLKSWICDMIPNRRKRDRGLRLLQANDGSAERQPGDRRARAETIFFILRRALRTCLIDALHLD